MNKHFIAFGPNVWGKGRTEQAAVKAMNEANWNGPVKSYDIYECHPDTNITGLGDFEYPKGEAPKQIRRIRKGVEEKF